MLAQLAARIRERNADGDGEGGAIAIGEGGAQVVITEDCTVSAVSCI